MLAPLTDSPVFARHTLDAPYRVCSWALDAWANIWQSKTPTGEPLAWAVMQGPWHTLDYATRPDQAARLWPELWAWGQARARTIAGRRGKPFTLHVEVHPDHPVAHTLLAETATLTYRRPHLLRPLNAPMLMPPLVAVPPAGVQVRPLRGEAEASAYVLAHRSAFDSTAMTLEWRQRTLLHPAYAPELDLVAVDAAGRLVGFVIGWQSGPAVMVEPVGVLPAWQGRGVGRALLAALAVAARARQAETLHAEPATATALAFFRALDFAPAFSWAGYTFTATP